MHHVIYLPKLTTADAQHLAAAGLADHAGGARFIPLPGDRRVTDGHSGGLLVAWDNAGAAAARDPSTLHWLPAMPLDGLPAARYYVGVDNARPPQPHELLKRHAFPGTPVSLGDSGQWVIPHASALPFDLIRHPQTGEIEHQPRPQFYAFWTKCLAWQRLFDAAAQAVRDGLTLEQPFPDEAEQLEFLEEALRLNYRLTPELISDLKLFSSGPAGTLQATLTACLHVAPGGGV